MCQNLRNGYLRIIQVCVRNPCANWHTDESPSVVLPDRNRGPRLLRCALSLAGVLAYFTFAASASAFGPEAAPGVEATSGVTSVAPSPAPDAAVVESVELGQYHGSDTAATAPLPDPAPLDQPAESSQSAEDSARPAHPGLAGVAGNHTDAKAGGSSHRPIAAAVALHAERNMHVRGKWYRQKNYQYQFDGSTTPGHTALQREIQPMRVHSASRIEHETERPIVIWIRRHGDHLKAQHHASDIALKASSGQAPGLLSKLKAAAMLKAADTEALEEAGKLFIFRAPRPSPAPVRSAVVSASSNSSMSRLNQPTSGFAGGVLRTGTRAARAIDRHKPVTSSIVPRLGAVVRPTGSIRPSVEVAERLTDTRRLVQIGLLLGVAYVGFLMLWFWTTRGRGRRLRGGARF